MRKNRRRRPRPAAKKQSKPWWLRFLESNGGTALITVLIGGLLGSLVTSMLQSGAKTREFQLAAYKEYLDQEREIVFSTSELIGQSISASDDLIALTGEDFDPAQYPGVEAQRLNIRKAYNATEDKWRNQYHRISFAMGYYHRGRPEVIRSWAAVQEATTAYMACAQQWYLDHNTAPVATAYACKVEKDSLKGRLDEFNERVSAERQYVWQEWQTQGGPATATNVRPAEVYVRRN